MSATPAPARAPLVVAIVGATATGKTEIAEMVAARLDAEVVCADSRQVFRELEIGTGKPDPAARAARPHHLFDALALGDPAARPSAGWYARAAGVACAAVHARGHAVVLVGGSGLYLSAARGRLSATPPHDTAVRARLRDALETEGPEALHTRLRRADPETAARLAPRDRQRVSRALEVFESSGRPLSWWHRQTGGPAVAGTWRIAEIVRPAAALDGRIAVRTTWMFDHGLLDECRAMQASGRGPALRALRAVGYDEALDLLAGRLSRAAAEVRTTLRTRQLAKRQRTWFRHQIEAVRIDAGDHDAAALAEAIMALAHAPAP